MRVRLIAGSPFGIFCPGWKVPEGGTLRPGMLAVIPRSVQLIAEDAMRYRASIQRAAPLKPVGHVWRVY